MINKDYVPQVDENDCCAAYLAIISKNYKSSVSIVCIRNLVLDYFC